MKITVVEFYVTNAEGLDELKWQGKTFDVLERDKVKMVADAYAQQLGVEIKVYWYHESGMWPWSCGGEHDWDDYPWGEDHCYEAYALRALDKLEPREQDYARCDDDQKILYAQTTAVTLATIMHRANMMNPVDMWKENVWS
jgi:hypothetical protein